MKDPHLRFSSEHAVLPVGLAIASSGNASMVWVDERLDSPDEFAILI